MDPMQFEVKVITLSKEPANSMLENFTSNGIAVSSLNFGRLKGLLLNKSAIDRIVKEYSPDILQSMGLRSDGYLTRYQQRITCITTSRNFPVIDYPKKYGKIKGGMMARQHLQYFKKLLVVSCSYAIAKQLSTVGVDSVVIQNGIDLDVFKPVPDKIQKRAELGLPASARIFVVVGSLIERKNVRMIVDAFTVNYADALLLVIGDGPDREGLKHAAKGKNIRFLGEISNVLDYLQCADIMVSASLAEGLPNSVLEGLACGLSLILSDIEPHKEIIQGSTLEGWLFRTENQLIDLIDESINSYDQPISSSDSLSLIEKFSAKKMSQNYQELYLTKL